MKIKDILLQESQVASAINSAIDQIDPNLGYKDFAIGVAKVIKDEYGSHLITPFMEVLHKHLGLEETVDESFDEMDLEEISEFLSNEYPELRFDDRTKEGIDRIDVHGKEQDKADFGDKYSGQTFGDYEVFTTEDDDRGEIVRIIRSSSLHR